MPSEAKEALYRIAQEALQNTVRHAGATNVGLGVGRANGGLTLDVSDARAGFDPAGAFPGHLGPKSMRERAERLGGTLEIEGAPGRGTRVRVSIPSPSNEGHAGPIPPGQPADGAAPTR